MTNPARLLVVLLSAALVGGCGPTSVTFTFGLDNAKLAESTVLGKDGNGDKVALIDVRGLIIDEDRPGWFERGSNPVDDLVSRLDKAAADGQVKAVLLRINSPGGAVTASDTMYREIVRFRETSKKPVVVSMSDVAASGGYYVALSGDEIMAQPTTITGSIGVIIPTMNFAEGLHRIGIISRSVKSGQNKDLANPLEPMRDSQYAILQELVNRMYSRFRNLVIERRTKHGLDVEQADTLMDGRVMTGDEALRVGLVDSVGDLHDAFDAAKKRAGIPKARLVKYHSEGESPRTAYASGGTARPTAGMGVNPAGPGGTEINLLQLNLSTGTASAGSGLAYYLWMPNTP